MTSRRWNTACPDWQDRIRQRRSLLPELPLYPAEASRAVRIFDMLRLPDVPGQPYLREAAGEWFRDALRALFGSYDEATGVRHLSELFVLVPKKSSKTTYAAALMLVALFVSRRPRAEFLLIGPTKEVADLAYRQAVGMIEADPVLLAKCHIQDHIKRIGYRTTGCFLKVKSFNPRVVTGSKPAGVLLDEVHVISEQHDADRVLGQLRGGLVSQPEGFLVQITTQSERAPAGVFRAELLKARMVRDGKLVAPMLPLLYEFPPDTKWRDVDNWPMVLPNLGRSITLDRLATDYRQAEAAGIGELARWASQHLNVEIGLALISDGWAGAEFWPACGAGLTLDAVIERSEVLAIGVDGGGLDDMFGLCVMGRETGTGRWLAWHHAWMHPIALERRKENEGRYRDFERDGSLTITEEDLEQIVAVIVRVWATGLLSRIGVDSQGIGQLLDALDAEGIESDLIVAINQGWKLTGAIKTVERKLASKELLHDGSALMSWCAGNAKVVPAGNAVLVTKAAAGFAKIDPLCALFDAAQIMTHNPAAANQPAVIVL